MAGVVGGEIGGVIVSERVPTAAEAAPAADIGGRQLRTFQFRTESGAERGRIAVAMKGRMRYMACMRELGQSATCHANFPRDVRRPPSSVLSGFSLIELLVVLALLIVLTTMYWGFGSVSYQRRQKIACQQNLQKIDVAMRIFANDSAGKFPVTAAAHVSEEALDVLVPRYTADTSLFVCPGSKDGSLPSGESFRNRKISYAY
jgi:prepilin-type N-terminal cleavage/methylation domain-containing protein